MHLVKHKIEPFIESSQNFSRIRNRTETCNKIVSFEEYVPGNEWTKGYVLYKKEKNQFIALISLDLLDLKSKI